MALLIIFSISVFFLPKNSEQTHLTGKFIDEGSQEQAQLETQSSSQSDEEIETTNSQQTNDEQIQEQSNQEEEKCDWGYSDEYQCDGKVIRTKWISSDCSFDWFYYLTCDYGCENGECIDKPAQETQEQLDSFKITYVVDGDTLEIDTGERVRLICIDTPETGDYYYQEAKDYLKNLVLNKEVRLVKDVSETDKYGRLLRYLYLEDGTFVNEKIVYYGYGEAYPYNPDTSLCPIIQQAEQHAKDNNLGIWEEIIEEPTEESSPSSDIICSSDYYNCGDFNTCSEVMEIFNTCNSDIHGLDGDDNGIPCESLCN